LTQETWVKMRCSPRHPTHFNRCFLTSIASYDVASNVCFRPSMQVDNPKDPRAFHARSSACPWAKPNLQATLERATDTMAGRCWLTPGKPQVYARLTPSRLQVDPRLTPG